jgi:hypothetical protein
MTQQYSPSDFLHEIAPRPISMLDRAIALLWHAGADDVSRGMTAKDIAETLHAAGYPEQNISRLERSLKEDRRTVRARPAGWRITPQARLHLNEEYAFASTPRPLAHRDSVLPKDLVTNTRGYVEKVVEQINKSYDAELFDCTAVMCRRLLETLIIEVYESKGRANVVKGADGHFMMLSGLLEILENDTSVHLSRNGLAGLRSFKTLGDLSAHNRRFNARRPDVDRIRDGLRVAVEELVHLAGFNVGQSSAAEATA